MPRNTTVGHIVDTLTAWGRERATKRSTQTAVSDAKTILDAAVEQGHLPGHVEGARQAWIAAGNANLRQHDRVAALHSELCSIADALAKGETDA